MKLAQKQRPCTADNLSKDVGISNTGTSSEKSRVPLSDFSKPCLFYFETRY